MFCGLRLFCCFRGGSFKVGVNVNLKGILRGLKKGQKKENYFWNTNRQLNPTQEHTRLVGDSLGVHISIFKLHQILTISYFSKFYYYFEKNYPLQNLKIYKTPQNIDLCFEHWFLYCLKREGDISIKPI